MRASVTLVSTRRETVFHATPTTGMRAVTRQEMSNRMNIRSGCTARCVPAEARAAWMSGELAHQFERAGAANLEPTRSQAASYEPHSPDSERADGSDYASRDLNGRGDRVWT
jgi:hypothetical protein